MLYSPTQIIIDVNLKSQILSRMCRYLSGFYQWKSLIYIGNYLSWVFDKIIIQKEKLQIRYLFL